MRTVPEIFRRPGSGGKYGGVMSFFAVIDTETTWRDEVMSVGAVVADSADFSVVDSRYYLVDPAYRMGGMYSGVLRMRGTPGEIIAARHEMAADMREWLGRHQVKTIFAYNATFDKKHLPEFGDFHWHDIMRVAAYRQYNSRIPETALCCKSGRLKSSYGVESIYRMLSGDCWYMEKHNGWYDAVDELKIMELLALPIEAYEHARI